MKTLKNYQVVLDGIGKICLNWYKLVNIMTLIKHIQPQWDTMLLNSCRKPAHHKNTQLVTYKPLHLVKYLLNHNTWTVCKTAWGGTRNNHNKQKIIFPTCTILHPYLDVMLVTEVKKYWRVYEKKTKKTRICKGIRYV